MTPDERAEARTALWAGLVLALALLTAVTIIVLAVVVPRLVLADRDAQPAQPAQVGASADTIAPPPDGTWLVVRPDRRLLDLSPIPTLGTGEERLAAFESFVQGQLPFWQTGPLVELAQAQCAALDASAGAGFEAQAQAAYRVATDAGFGVSDAANLLAVGVPAFCPKHWEALKGWAVMPV